VEVEVFSEGTLSGERRMTSIAYLTFVTVEQHGARAQVPPLRLDTDDDRRRAAEADHRRAARLRDKRSRQG
jgi:acyl-CoA hydrolase